MAAKKKALLPKNFDDMLDRGDLEQLKAVFDTCELNARGGYLKQTVLMHVNCPVALMRWVIEQGVDPFEPDQKGNTPLHMHAAGLGESLKFLLELGADVNAKNKSAETPLHEAASVYCADNARLLLEHGAKVDALSGNGMTPLELALRGFRGGVYENLVSLVKVLLAAGARKAPRMQEEVKRIGTDFEFVRPRFNPETVDQVSDLLDHLYVLFDIPPVPRRIEHDGKSPIVVQAGPWPDQHQALWEMLVPGNGHAATVQGEVIRVTGRISYELNHNGGTNWDADYSAMADAFMAHIRSGNPLGAAEFGEAATLISQVKRRQGNTDRMCELAIAWVTLNPVPMALPKPQYKR